MNVPYVFPDFEERRHRFHLQFKQQHYAECLKYGMSGQVASAVCLCAVDDKLGRLRSTTPSLCWFRQLTSRSFDYTHAGNKASGTLCIYIYYFL